MTRLTVQQMIAKNIGSLLLGIIGLGLPFAAEGQRNFVEVPSSEIVEPNKLFIQGQISFKPEEISTSAIVTYGLLKNFEIGIVLYKVDFKRSVGIQISSDHPEENPDILVSAQKGFEINSWLKVGLGTEFGLNVVKSTCDLRFVDFSYLNSQVTFGARKHMMAVGVYYGDNAYVVNGTNGGVMAGIDLNLAKNKWHLVADFLSGTSSISVVNVALQLALGKDWKIMTGAQLPVPGSKNEYGGLLQISKN